VPYTRRAEPSAVSEISHEPSALKMRYQETPPPWVRAQVPTNFELPPPLESPSSSESLQPVKVRGIAKASRAIQRYLRMFVLSGLCFWFLKTDSAFRIAFAEWNQVSMLKLKSSHL
jgi:hypothetical protein